MDISDEECYRMNAEKFKKIPGSRVRIFRIAKSYENGWTNCWTNEMDLSVGKIGTIMDDAHYNIHITVGIPIYIPNIGVCRYPYFVLDIV